MEVVIFTFILDSFPRYKNAIKRISGILERADKLFGKTNLSKTDSEKKLHDNLTIYHCEKEGLVRLDLNGENIAKKNHGVQDKITRNFDNTKSFLTDYQNTFNSTTVLIFQYYIGLNQDLEEFLPPDLIIPVIIVAKKQNENKPETCYRQNWKTVSTEEYIPDEISSLLEQIAFQRMKETFERVKGILEDNHEQKVSKPLTSTNGLYSAAHNHLRKSTERDTLPGNYNRKMNGNSDALPVNDNAYIRKTRSRTLLGTTKASKPQSPPNGLYCTEQNHLRKSTEKDTRTLPGDNNRKMNGYSDALPVDDNAYIRKTRSGTLLGTTEDEIKTKILIGSKAEFQRLLGEMIGMYRRSKLPKQLKPLLDGPVEGELSEQVMMNLYRISPSIKGYSYKFITRLQIHVLSDDIEQLKPKITDELDRHGFSSDIYDIVPAPDDATPLNKIIAGSKVGNMVEREGASFGTLTSFVKTKSDETKGPRYCSLASKHLLDGRESIQISSIEQTITAAVIKETAPGDGNMYVDIAAAVIKKEDETVCDGRFKTEDGTLIKGIVYNKDDSLLACQHVHINGASTSLGLGIIAFTQFNGREPIEARNGQNKSCKSKQEEEKSNEINKFIYVESRNKSSPFCTGGDSGAMVCADDEDGEHVELISTVIGKVVNQRETKQCGAANVKENDNAVYQTLRLETGISHLKKLIKSEIDFFDS